VHFEWWVENRIRNKCSKSDCHTSFAKIQSLHLNQVVFVFPPHSKAGDQKLLYERLCIWKVQLRVRTKQLPADVEIREWISALLPVLIDACMWQMLELRPIKIWSITFVWSTSGPFIAVQAIGYWFSYFHPQAREKRMYCLPFPRWSLLLFDHVATIVGALLLTMTSGRIQGGKSVLPKSKQLYEGFVTYWCTKI